MRDDHDLDSYRPSGNQTGDYRVSDPVNAWDGASDDVTIFQRYVGGHDWQFQIGVDSQPDPTAPPSLYARLRFQDGPWGAWTAAGEVPPAPAPGPSPTTAAIDAAKTAITVTFNGPLKDGLVGLGNFDVDVAGAAGLVAAAVANGSALVLTLGTPAVAGDVITVAYAVTTTPYLRGADNSPVEPFAGLGVTNPAARTSGGRRND